MSDSRSYVALDWVNAQIAETLQQANDALAGFVANPQDVTKLRFGLTYIHQVSGSLVMLELYVATLLSKEIERLLNNVLESPNAVVAQVDAAKLVMPVLADLQCYLDALVKTHDDNPQSLIKILNHIREANGDEPLTESELFNPNIAIAHEVDKKQPKIAVEEFNELIRKLRQSFQVSLIGIVRDKDLATQYELLVKVCVSLQKVSEGTASYPLWEIAYAIADQLQQANVATDIETKKSLKLIDTQIKYLEENGRDALAAPTDSALIKTLLYSVAKADLVTDEIARLKAIYQLDKALEIKAEAQEEPIPQKRMIDALIIALSKDVSLLASFDIEVMHAALLRIQNTLQVLAIKDILPVMQNIEQAIHTAIDDGVDISESAEFLCLQFELLEVFLQQWQKRTLGLDGAIIVNRYQVYLANLREDVDALKQSFVEYAQEGCESSLLQYVPSLLERIVELVTISTLKPQLEVITYLQSYIHDHLLNALATPKNAVLQAIAEAISSVDYYIERLPADTLDNLNTIHQVALDSVQLLSQADILIDDTAKDKAIDAVYDDVRGISELDIDDSLEFEVIEDYPTVMPLDNFIEDSTIDAANDAELEDELVIFTPGPEADDEILEIFVEEAREVIAHIIEYLPVLEANYDNVDALLEIRRSYHTLKGSGRMVGALHIGEFAWSVERMLNKVRDGIAKINPTAITVLHLATDLMPELVDDLENRVGVSKRRIQYVVDKADAEWEGRTLDEVIAESEVAQPLVEEMMEDDEAFSFELDDTSDVVENESDVAAENNIEKTAEEAEFDRELLAIFITEADSHIQVLSDYLDNIDPGYEDVRVSSDLQRSLHTLKGSSHMAGIDCFATIATPLEAFVKDLNNFQTPVDAEILAILVRSCELLQTQLRAVKQGDLTLVANAPAFIEELKRLHTSTIVVSSEDEVEEQGFVDKYTVLLTEALDSLTNAADLLKEWSATGLSSDKQDDLINYVYRLSGTAGEANYQEIELLAEALGDFYSKAIQSASTFTAAFFELADRAHEELEDMMDMIAGQQLVEPANELILALKQGIAPEEELNAIQEIEEPSVNLPKHNAFDLSELRIQLLQADADTLEIFAEEAGELLDVLDNLMQAWFDNHKDRSGLGEINRAIHTLKGGARLTELQTLANLCHAYEGCIEKADASGKYNDAFFNTVQEFQNQLAYCIDYIVSAEYLRDEPAELVAEVIEPIISLSQEDTSLLSVTEDAIDLPEAEDIVLEIPSEDDHFFDRFEADGLDADGLDTEEPVENINEVNDQEFSFDDIHLDNDFDDIIMPAYEAEIDAEIDQEVELDDALNSVDKFDIASDYISENTENDVVADEITPIDVESIFDEFEEANDLDIFDEFESIDIGEPTIAAMTAVASAPILTATYTILAEEYRKGDPDTLEIFLEEALELDDELENVVGEWLANHENIAQADALKRILHTLKGGARLAELSPLGNLTHDYETKIEHAEARRTFDVPFFAQIQQYQDQVHSMIQFLANGARLEDIPVTQDTIVEELHPIDESSLETTIDIAMVESVEPIIEAIEIKHVVIESEEYVVEETEVDDQSEFAILAQQYRKADQDTLEIFLEEALELDTALEDTVNLWLGDRETATHADSMKRLLHTLKGGARLAELAVLGDLTHNYESMIEHAEARKAFDDAFFVNMQNYHDQLHGMIEFIVNGAKSTDIPANIATLVQPTVELKDLDAMLHVEEVIEPIVPSEDIDSELLSLFVEEAREQSDAIEECITQFLANADDKSQLEELKRLLHTLKGGARLTGLRQIGDLSHDFETYIINSERSHLVANSFVDGMQSFHDKLSKLIAAIQITPVAVDSNITVAAESNIVPIRPDIASGKHNELASQAAIDATRAFIDNFNKDQQRSNREAVKIAPDLLEDLINLAGESSIGRSRIEEQVNEIVISHTEMDVTVDRLHNQLRRLEIETEAQIDFRKEQVVSEGHENFDPLEMDRYTHMQQLSKSLIESASDLDDISVTFTNKMRDMETLLLQQARINTELQEGLMRCQMVPFSRMVPRLRRIVRQIAQELGKKVEFEVENAEGELDRTILERMVAPLEHMLRNAVDHGIEMPDVRKAAGKPIQGTIKLVLSREGGEIVLNLLDDGAGVNIVAVRKKAIERGLMAEDATLSDHELSQFILHAGFSTAQKVTQISGRGVGMDVVHSEIKQMGGSLDINSQQGKGSNFTVRLPFTVSVNRALMVVVGLETYAIPLNAIEGIVRVSPYELEAYYQPDAPMFEYAGQGYNLRYMGGLLKRGQLAKLEGLTTPLPVVLIRSSEYTVAVQVDKLLGSREVVVKSLGPQFGMVGGLSGATVLGDGSVVVILDMLSLIRTDIALGTLQLQGHRKDEFIDEVERKVTTVMVVDDSVTVRKVTSRLLERFGLNVILAKDGLDALTQLQEMDNLPDIMLLDIEMPRMDGFEVVSRVRHDNRLQHIPITMITSRTGDKHRERALSLGANRYLGKPFQERELLQIISDLTGADIQQA